MLESGSSGSVRGVPSNGHPYRNPGPFADVRPSPLSANSVGYPPVGYPAVASRRGDGRLIAFAHALQALTVGASASRK